MLKSLHINVLSDRERIKLDLLIGSASCFKSFGLSHLEHVLDVVLVDRGVQILNGEAPTAIFKLNVLKAEL